MTPNKIAILQMLLTRHGWQQAEIDRAIQVLQPNEEINVPRNQS